MFNDLPAEVIASITLSEDEDEDEDDFETVIPIKRSSKKRRSVFSDNEVAGPSHQTFPKIKPIRIRTDIAKAVESITTPDIDLDFY